jgi:hypothetical protein
MHVNKVSSVRTINLVAKDLGEDEDWLCDVASEMEPEDGLIWFMGSAKTVSWHSLTSGSRT